MRILSRKPEPGEKKDQVPILKREDPHRKDVWKEYVRTNHTLEDGLKSIHLDFLFNKEIYEVGPISHLNAGMMPADLALLRGLASLYPECSYFEICKRRSESIGNMAKVARECYSLSKPAGEMRKKGIRNKYMYMMGNYSVAPDNVLMLSGDSLIFDFSSLNKRFDIIFINSSHRYERIMKETGNAFEYLAHERSIIVWHDYSYFPDQIRFEVLAGILDGTAPAYREQLFFVSKTKCAIFLPSQIKQTWKASRLHHLEF